MIEKDFRKIISDFEANYAMRPQMSARFEEIAALLQKELVAPYPFQKAYLVGAWAKLTAFPGDPLVIALQFDETKLSLAQYRERAINNAIENALIKAWGDKIKSIERNDWEKRTKFSLDNETYWFDIDPQLKEIKEVEFVNNANSEYTLFRNTVIIIKNACNDIGLKTIDEAIIETILYHSLRHYQITNKYYDYLDAFVKGMDDFFAPLPIEVGSAMYQKLGLSEPEKFDHKYIVVSPGNPKLNLAGDLNDLNIGDYRKLRKKVAKMLENPKVDPFLFDQSTEVVVDVNPAVDKLTGKLKWRYIILGKNLTNSGGEYNNDEVSQQTAILKAIFKGLKALEANNLFKKKIIIQAEYEDFLGSRMLSTDENKSRMKTIKAFIEKNKLNIIQTKGKSLEE
ncbi:MAG: hypothetical protein PHG08_04825 [Bacilli bacterium]|jgi:hypothetical protein|nr:hypothetical protein [Bacilli bacterium]HHU24008.1 hypothetical protein [Acholeplasmataceae bacterium]